MKGRGILKLTTNWPPRYEGKALSCTSVGWLSALELLAYCSIVSDLPTTFRCLGG
jgi:hypothetical protein